LRLEMANPRALVALSPNEHGRELAEARPDPLLPFVFDVLQKVTET